MAAGEEERSSAEQYLGTWQSRFRLAGRVAVATGASSGLGVAIAMGTAAAGADVVIGARRVAMLEETRAAVEKLGRRCVAVETDVTRVEHCERLVAAATSEFGRLDVLGACPLTEVSPVRLRTWAGSPSGCSWASTSTATSCAAT